jgi:LysM repeat protein
MGYMVVREVMAGQSHGTFRNPRREEESSSGTGFRMMMGMVGFVILIALITIAMALRKLRTEHFGLRDAVVGGAGRAVQIDDETIQSLRAEVEALSEKLESANSAEAAMDRLIIKEALAKLLHQHEAGSTEISDLIGGLTDQERLTFMTEFGTADPSAGHAGIREQIAAVHEGNGHGTEVEPTPPPTPELPSTPEPTLTPEPPPTPEPTLTPEPPPTPEPPLTPEPTLTPEPPPLPADFTEYTVKSGDILSRIARNHGVTLDSIQKANGVINPDKIKVGDVLKIPSR